MQSGAQLVRRKKEKTATILVSIIIVFLLCHFHRIAFRLYELALPETSLYEHYMFCDQQGRYHVPVAIYFLTHIHYLFLALNSSVNFVIYCAMGQHFRKQLCKLFCHYLQKIRRKLFHSELQYSTDHSQDWFILLFLNFLCFDCNVSVLSLEITSRKLRSSEWT